MTMNLLSDKFLAMVTFGDDDTVIMGDGDEETNAGLTDNDTDYPDDVCVVPIPSISTGRRRGRGGRSRGRRRAKKGGIEGGRGNEAVQGISQNIVHSFSFQKTYSYLLFCTVSDLL